MQNRRTLLTAAGTGALVSLLSSTRQTMAQAATSVPPTETNTVPTDPFVLLLRGVYVPIVRGPDLGLNGIDLTDGTYSRTRIYPVFGIPSSDNENQNGNDINVNMTPIGNFFVQLKKFQEGVPMPELKLAYQLPGGAMSMMLLPAPTGGPPGYNMFNNPYPDGAGGSYLEGTFELTIPDANGIYEQFKGGHNHMVDRLHVLANGQFDEFCFCNISQYPFP